MTGFLFEYVYNSALRPPLVAQLLKRIVIPYNLFITELYVQEITNLIYKTSPFKNERYCS